ncbi:MAG: DNA-3-methyladenine glycosylase [Beutenbergiaceae bacterium]
MSDVDRELGLTGRALQVAPRLLGALLTSTVDGESVTVRITEVEAYEGVDDPASHAYRGPTARNEVMFGPAGFLYVYRHLGLHHCANVVVGPPGVASAVLLRAGEVVQGQEVALGRRQARGVCRTSRDIARGPARLAVALALTREHNGLSLTVGEVLRLRAGRPGEVCRGPRVGIAGSGPEAASWPWRFWHAGSEFVSVTG